ncbi:L-ascorbate oxidase protein [Trifolium repens]|nr:L-ascorbate oxidase protein [Trifolium repens]
MVVQSTQLQNLEPFSHSCPFSSFRGRLYHILAGDWFKLGHRRLRRVLENGHNLPFLSMVVVGMETHFATVNQGKTYGFRISNAGLAASININFRIQGHSLKTLIILHSTTSISTHLRVKFLLLGVRE